jgi:hypothetical protein
MHTLYLERPDPASVLDLVGEKPAGNRRRSSVP